MALRQSSTTVLTSLMAAVALAACGGGGGGSDDTTPPPAPNPGPVASYAVGGEVAGLASGQSLVLHNNGADAQTRGVNGAFEFVTKVEQDKDYNVTVATQPQTQICAVTNGSGKAKATVSDIKVQCTDTPISTDTSAACFLSMRAYTEGNIWSYVTPTGKSTFKATGAFTFQGASVRRVGEFFNDNIVRARYIHFADGIHYVDGYVQSIGVVNIPGQFVWTYTPALATPAAIPSNRPYSSNTTRTFERSGAIGSATATAMTQTTAYQGRESVKTAFGTFDTCKMEYTTQDEGAPAKVTKDWVIASGKFTGLVAQSESDGKLTQPSNIEVNWN